MNNIKQNPFSLYDFLGYFVPGAFAIYSLIFTYGHIYKNSSIELLRKYLSFNSPELYIPFIIFSYILGHFLSFISSITIEKYSNWAFGYPSKYLLGMPPAGYFTVGSPKTIRFLIRIFICIFMFPISILDYIFGKRLHMRELYTKKLDSLLIVVIKKKVEAILSECCASNYNSDLSEDDFFRYIYHYAVENAKNHAQKMQNYVALYGFLRTITLILVMLFWILLWHVYYSEVSILKSLVLLTVYSLIPYIFFMAFEKFYRRFSLEAMMATAVVYSDKSKTI